MDVVWQDPPPASSQRNRTETFVALLQERPGTWAVYPTTLGSSAGLSVYRRKFPSVEWTTRKRPDGRVDVYARWIEGK